MAGARASRYTTRELAFGAALRELYGDPEAAGDRCGTVADGKLASRHVTVWIAGFVDVAAGGGATSDGGS